DRNPIHMDPRIAQRSFAGERVVHGMHVLLAALEHFVTLRRESLGFGRLRCEFRHPILIDELVQFEYREQRRGGIRLAASVERAACQEIRLDEQVGAESEPARPDPMQVDARLDSISEPLDQDPRRLAAFAGTISNAPAAGVTMMFPSLCAAIGPSTVTALARLSYIVGMLCPGLYSVFSSLDVAGAAPPAAAGRYHVS